MIFDSLRALLDYYLKGVKLVWGAYKLLTNCEYLCQIM